jgi:uncharacterized protein DUF3237
MLSVERRAHKMSINRSRILTCLLAGALAPALAVTAASGAPASTPGGEAAQAQRPDNPDATLVPDPSWTCGAPDGIPPPTRGKPVFKATLQLGEIHDVGATQYGHRRVLDVRSGTLTGDRVQGTVLGGAEDLELTLSNGSVEFEQLYTVRMNDDSLIFLRGCGVAAPGDTTIRLVPDFEAANSSAYAWLNSGRYAGTRTVDPVTGTVAIGVYDVSDVAVTDPQIRLTDPVAVPNQTWECATGTGSKGASVFSEVVTLGPQLSVGTSKRGPRNIIPLTGGTVSGRVTGRVLPGGADFQIVGITTTLDARYTLATNDGEFIVVRNCGPINALVPVFETRSAGAYGYLNTGTYLSSSPAFEPGPTSAVRLTFSERN